MESKEREYRIVVWIKGRAKPLTGVRKYLAYQLADVYSLVNQSLLKFYFQDDILKIEVKEIDPMQPTGKKR